MASKEAAPYYTVSDVCARFGVSRSTVYRWLTQGYLPQPVRIGPRCVRWSQATIVAFEERLGADGGGR